MNFFKKRKLRKESERYILQQIYDAERRGYEQGLIDMRRLKQKEIGRKNKRMEALTQRVNDIEECLEREKEFNLKLELLLEQIEEIKFATISYINKDFARTQGLKEELGLIKRASQKISEKVYKKIEKFKRVAC